jgi:hypothetical protein
MFYENPSVCPRTLFSIVGKSTEMAAVVLGLAWLSASITNSIDCPSYSICCKGMPLIGCNFKFNTFLFGYFIDMEVDGNL